MAGIPLPSGCDVRRGGHEPLAVLRGRNGAQKRQLSLGGSRHTNPTVARRECSTLNNPNCSSSSIRPANALTSTVMAVSSRRSDGSRPSNASQGWSDRRAMLLNEPNWWNRDHGSRPRRAGIRVRMIPGWASVPPRCLLPIHRGCFGSRELLPGLKEFRPIRVLASKCS